MGKKKVTEKKTRNIAFTEFNLDLLEDYLALVDEGVCTYVVLGKESCPDTKREHLQGYLRFVNARSFYETTTIFGKTHREICWRDPEKNEQYCKKDKHWVERGTMPSQGKRTDIEDVKHKIDSGVHMGEIAQEHFNIYLQYGRMLKMYRKDTVKKRDVMTEGIWIHGDSGCGKSTWVKHAYPNACWLEYDGKYFSNYDNEEIVIFDDQNYDLLTRPLLLKLLNHIPYKLRVMGDYVEFNAKKIIFIDNFLPNNYWAMDKALRRRIEIMTFGTEVLAQKCPIG